MKSKAYDDWVGLYNDNLVEIWHQERDELKMTSMILWVLKRELNRIQTEAERNVATTRKYLQEKDESNIIMPACISSRESKSNKDNTAGLWTSACLGVKPLDDIGEDIQSPEIFRVASPKRTTSDMADGLKENETSPTIKKRMKRPRNRFNQNPSPFLLLGENAKEKVQASPAQNRLINMELKTPENLLISKNASNLDEALIDSTIIDSTPCAPSTKKSKSFGHGRSHGKLTFITMKKPSKKVKCSSNDTTYLPNQTNTLTQMMSRDLNKVKMNEESTSKPTNEDLENSMSISDILAYVDEHQMNPCTPSKSTTSRTEINTKFPTSLLKQDVKGHQNSHSGWSCHDCENFYGKLNLLPEDLEKKMAECFKRHRKAELRQDTYAGFWDVGMPSTPESQLSNEQSTIFHP